MSVITARVTVMLFYTTHLHSILTFIKGFFFLTFIISFDSPSNSLNVGREGIIKFYILEI